MSEIETKTSDQDQVPTDMNELMRRYEEISGRPAHDLIGMPAIDIDVVVAYHRQLRAKRQSGESRQRSKGATSAGGDLSALMKTLKTSTVKEDEPIKRRI